VHPSKAANWSDNDASCALLIEAGGRKILLPGDIEARAEQALVADTSVRDIDLLLAPHHGSRTSSSPAFVEAMSPGYAIFSAGYANRWGFPKPDIVQRWLDAGACTLSTAETGALEFRVSVAGELLLHSAARQSWRRPWVLRNVRAAVCGDTIKGQ
jgi:competence protein ComEC